MCRTSSRGAPCSHQQPGLSAVRAPPRGQRPASRGDLVLFVSGIVRGLALSVVGTGERREIPLSDVGLSTLLLELLVLLVIPGLDDVLLEIRDASYFFVALVLRP